MSVLKRFKDDLATITSWAEPLYKELHRSPELSMQETKTAQLIADRLESYGYEVHRIGGGVVGVLANGEGKTVLLRADFDGLPVEEQTGVDYASTATALDPDGNTVGVMHACGHDFHVTAGLAAAAFLADHREEWSGTHLALFQPGEETAAGARSMVDDGLVDRVPLPDVALSQHVTPMPAHTGEVALGAGPILSTAASLKVKVYGRGSHGSMPHLGVDPVLLAASIVTRLQGIVSREIAPSDFAVVTVGSLQSGSKANIIPADATLLLNIRAYSDEIRNRLIDAIKRIVVAECAASGSPQDPDFEIFDEFPLTDNDEDVTAKVRAAMIEHFGEEKVKQLSPLTASEDFSTLPSAFGVPYTYWVFGAYGPNDEAFPNHNPRFLPVLQPTLTTGVEAALVALLAFLGKEAC